MSENDVIVRFNDKFYKPEAIDFALRDFSNVCRFEKIPDGIRLIPIEKEALPLLGYEFYNYVLGQMKNQ